MKLQLFLLTIFISMSAAADTVNKWTDEHGKVHYGDQKASEYVKGTENVKIKDTYDQQSYDEGMERHKENQEIGDQLEKDRIKEEAKRDAEEKEKEASRPARPGGTAVAPNLSNRSLPIPNRPLRPENRPVQLPAK